MEVGERDEIIDKLSGKNRMKVNNFPTFSKLIDEGDRHKVEEEELERIK